MSDALIEIERKFLVDGDFKSEAAASVHIIQGYLNRDPARTVRIRIQDGSGLLTVKGISSGASRFEWEITIPEDDARRLLALAEPGIIDKTRYLVPASDGHVWEVDEFHGNNEGLVVAEIELGDENEPFVRPVWAKKEVTGDPGYFNSSLAKTSKGVF